MTHRFTKEDLGDRLAYDFEIIQAMNSDPQNTIFKATAFDSKIAAQKNQNPILDQRRARSAKFYVVGYNIRSLSGKGIYHQSFTLMVDVMGGGNYPWSEPTCTITSRPLPWSPHFHPAHGLVCQGEFWDASKTLGSLLNHVARLLNWEEKDRGSGYEGWNGEAIRYWRSALKSKPLNKLIYPTASKTVGNQASVEEELVFVVDESASQAVNKPEAEDLIFEVSQSQENIGVVFEIHNEANHTKEIFFKPE